MARCLSAAALVLALIVPAVAEDGPANPRVAAWTERFDQMNESCEVDRASPACIGAIKAVQSDVAAALTTISHMSDRDAAREAVRPALVVDAPGVQTAAAYALARLGPEPQDTQTLTALLGSPIPTLRRAAWGALNASPDPAAREWAARAKPQLVGERFVDDRRPVDAATLGVELPSGSTPVWFEVVVWKSGAQVFTAEDDPGAVITYFSGIAGRGSVPLAETKALFEADKDAARSFERFSNGAWYQSPYVVVLDDGVEGDSEKPKRLAIVWYDPLLGKTGFALQWLPAASMPSFSEYPWSGSSEPLKSLGGAEIVDPGAPDTSWVRPDAPDFDTQAFSFARDGGIAAAEDYLDMFPDGAYRAEAEAMKSEPWVRATADDPVEPTEVRIAYANLPTDKPIRFDVVSEGTIMSWAAQSAPSAPPPDMAVEAPAGQASGEVVWRSDRMLKPGLYAIRVFYGEDKMDFDGLSLARMMPGGDVQLYASLRILPRMVEIALDKPVYGFAEAVRISYKGMAMPLSDNAAHPFFTIVKKGAPRKEWGRYVYTKEQTDGQVILEAPSTPGDYEVRALFAEDGIVRGVAAFTVDPARATAPVPTPTPEPTPVPTPEPEDMAVVITLDKPSFAPDEPITGKVTGLPGDRDWIAVVPAGSEDGTTGKWVYAGKDAKEATFTLPGQPAGAYEIRVRYRDQYRPVRRRLAFEVK